MPANNFDDSATSFGATMGEFIARTLISFLMAWIVMLTLGSLRLDYYPQIPALSYWQTFGVLLTIRALFLRGEASPGNKRRKS